MKKILIVLIIVVLATIGCNREDTPVPANYWALSEGNQWTTVEDYTWTISGNPTSSSSTTSYEVLPFEELDNGKLAWPVETITNAEGTEQVPVTQYYHTTEDSVYIYLTKDAEQPSLTEPNDLTMGAQWEGEMALPIKIGTVDLEYPARFTVVGETTGVQVQAGTFDCLVIRIDFTNPVIDSAATEWRAKDVGRVKLSADFTATISVIGQVDVEGTSEMESMNF